MSKRLPEHLEDDVLREARLRKEKRAMESRISTEIVEGPIETVIPDIIDSPIVPKKEAEIEKETPKSIFKKIIKRRK